MVVMAAASVVVAAARAAAGKEKLTQPRVDHQDPPASFLGVALVAQRKRRDYSNLRETRRGRALGGHASERSARTTG